MHDGISGECATSRWIRVVMLQAVMAHRRDVSYCVGKDIASGQFVIAAVMVGGYNNYRVVDGAMVLIDSVAITF